MNYPEITLNGNKQTTINFYEITRRLGCLSNWIIKRLP